MIRKHKRKAADRYENLITYKDPKSTISEAYRTLRTNIQFASVDREVKTILVTSPGPSEGKSTTISNLAIVLAQAGNRVLLIDADMRKPTLHHFFRIPNQQGLSHLLTSQREMKDVTIATFVDGLYLIPSGPIPPNPVELIGSKRMTALLQTWMEQYDYILIDTPPVLAVTDAQVLANQMDGVLLVLHSGQTNKEAAKKAKELLDHVNAKILGAVLNNREIGGGGYYYYYYYGESKEG